jgi:hypothetical protein
MFISAGKYVQTESENYDEFLKALGVGMLLRKVNCLIGHLNEISTLDFFINPSPIQ